MSIGTSNIAAESFRLLTSVVRAVDLKDVVENNSTIRPEAITELASDLIGRLAVRRLDYYLHPEIDRGIVGYRPVDRLKRTETEMLGATAVLDAVAPLQLLVGEYFPERVNERTLADPKSAIHTVLTWNDVIHKHVDEAVQAARTQAERIVE